MKMLPLMEEVGVKKSVGFFFCILLDDKQCLLKKEPCPKDRKEQKCQEVEDAFA